MDISKFIEIAHKAQADAGSLDNFEMKTLQYMNATVASADPVAAFLGALLDCERSVEESVNSVDYYMDELNRAVIAIQKYYEQKNKI